MTGREAEGTTTAIRRPGRQLTLEEVVTVGRPALYLRFGEALLFVDNTIFDVREPGSPIKLSLEVSLDDPRIASHAVGIEFGWRHASGCLCPLCAPQGSPPPTSGAKPDED